MISYMLSGWKIFRTAGGHADETEDGPFGCGPQYRQKACLTLFTGPST